ncbi:uncharacterized protein LOC143024660 isoform X2 [Oratosquilla oratoria]|uniref:uncharacterized protein LOC143024660 isoform X2 n=1 Tax=Oratosquilla oratoria TaxID=337810 RepID=UPI003F75F9B6
MCIGDRCSITMSLIKIRGCVILPPVLNDDERRQMQHYREQAKEIEERFKATWLVGEPKKSKGKLKCLKKESSSSKSSNNNGSRLASDDHEPSPPPCMDNSQSTEVSVQTDSSVTLTTSTDLQPYMNTSVDTTNNLSPPVSPSSDLMDDFGGGRTDTSSSHLMERSFKSSSSALDFIPSVSGSTTLVMKSDLQDGNRSTEESAMSGPETTISMSLSNVSEEEFEKDMILVAEMETESDTQRSGDSRRSSTRELSSKTSDLSDLDIMSHSNTSILTKESSLDISRSNYLDNYLEFLTSRSVPKPQTGKSAPESVDNEIKQSKQIRMQSSEAKKDQFKRSVGSIYLDSYIGNLTEHSWLSYPTDRTLKRMVFLDTDDYLTKVRSGSPRSRTGSPHHSSLEKNKNEKFKKADSKENDQHKKGVEPLDAEVLTAMPKNNEKDSFSKELEEQAFYDIAERTFEAQSHKEPTCPLSTVQEAPPKDDSFGNLYIICCDDPKNPQLKPTPIDSILQPKVDIDKEDEKEQEEEVLTKDTQKVTEKDKKNQTEKLEHPQTLNLGSSRESSSSQFQVGNVVSTALSPGDVSSCSDDSSETEMSTIVFVDGDRQPSQTELARSMDISPDKADIDIGKQEMYPLEFKKSMDISPDKTEVEGLEMPPSEVEEVHTTEPSIAVDVCHDKVEVEMEKQEVCQPALVDDNDNEVIPGRPRNGEKMEEVPFVGTDGNDIEMGGGDEDSDDQVEEEKETEDTGVGDSLDTAPESTASATDTEQDLSKPDTRDSGVTETASVVTSSTDPLSQIIDILQAKQREEMQALQRKQKKELEDFCQQLQELPKDQLHAMLIPESEEEEEEEDSHMKNKGYVDNITLSGNAVSDTEIGVSLDDGDDGMGGEIIMTVQYSDPNMNEVTPVTCCSPRVHVTYGSSQYASVYSDSLARSFTPTSSPLLSRRRSLKPIPSNHTNIMPSYIVNLTDSERSDTPNQIMSESFERTLYGSVGTRRDSYDSPSRDTGFKAFDDRGTRFPEMGNCYTERRSSLYDRPNNAATYTISSQSSPVHVSRSNSVPQKTYIITQEVKKPSSQSSSRSGVPTSYGYYAGGHMTQRLCSATKQSTSQNQQEQQAVNNHHHHHHHHHNHPHLQQPYTILRSSGDSSSHQGNAYQTMSGLDIFPEREKPLHPKSRLPTITKDHGLIRLQANVRRFIIQRLMRTRLIQDQLATLREIAKLATQFHKDILSDNIKKGDVEFHKALYNQDRTAREKIYSTMMSTPAEQIAIINRDKEMQSLEEQRRETRSRRPLSTHSHPIRKRKSPEARPQSSQSLHSGSLRKPSQVPKPTGRTNVRPNSTNSSPTTRKAGVPRCTTKTTHIARKPWR